MKKLIIPIMLAGCVLFNCLFVGGYKIFEAAREWLRPEPLQIDFMALETPELQQLKKEVESELKFRQGK